MIKWECEYQDQGEYKLFTENKKYGEIASLYNNEVYYKNIYKNGDPKFSYSMYYMGQSKHGEINAENLDDAKKQLEQIVIKVYKDMIDMMKRDISHYESILDMLSNKD